MVMLFQLAAGVRRGDRPPPLEKRGARAWDRAKEDAPRWNNRLVVHAVDDSTNVVYEREVKAFLVSCKRGEVLFESVEDRDRALGNYISDLCYLRGDNYMKASLAFNG